MVLCLPGPLPSDSSTRGGCHPQHLLPWLMVVYPSLLPRLLTGVFCKRELSLLSHGLTYMNVYSLGYHAILVF